MPPTPTGPVETIRQCQRDARMMAAQLCPGVIDDAMLLAERIPNLGMDGALEVLEAIGRFLVEEKPCTAES